MKQVWLVVLVASALMGQASAAPGHWEQPAANLANQIAEILGPVAAIEMGIVRPRASGPVSDISHVPLELARLGDYRIISYEGWIYGMPESMSDIDLRETDVIELAGVLRDVSRDVVEQMIRERTESSAHVSA